MGEIVELGKEFNGKERERFMEKIIEQKMGKTNKKERLSYDVGYAH
jgi:hypothetical protein